MVRLLLLLSIAAPQGGSEVALGIDRTTVQVGDSVTLTVTVRTPEVGPVDIDDPSVAGFEVVERRDRSQVSVGTGVRTMQRDIVLRAEESGDFSLGPVRVRIAGAARFTNAIQLSVIPAPGAELTLSPRVRDLVDRAVPVGTDSVAAVEVSVLRLADSVRSGEQIDLVVAAWFPRVVRARLRAPPVLLPPDVRGAWGYTQPTPAGVVGSREVDGRMYDLFVHHEIVFALTPGDLEVGPARVTYSLPISGSFLSREVRHEAQSTPFLVGVAPVATSAGAGMTVGRNLMMVASASHTLLPVGDAARLSITLRGSGNVALWPEPDLRWPAGIQAYQERSSVTLALEDGVLGGAKTFEYLVVADSGGVHRLPAPTYEYYDLDRDAVAVATTEPVVFETPEIVRRTEPLRTAPVLMQATWYDRLLRRLRTSPMWVWLLIFGLPPAAVGLGASSRYLRRRAIVTSERAGQPAGSLNRLDEQVRMALARLVPGADAGDPDRLAAALVAAGVEPSLAQHAARVRERLRRAMYGPEPQSDPGELAEEVEAVLQRLRGQGRTGRVSQISAMVVFLLYAGTGTLSAQTIDRLWDAGAVRAAAESLTVRVRGGDGAAADWYNLSVAWELLGEDARARAAWVEAVRAVPHDRRIRRAGARWADQTEGAPWVAPMAPSEFLMVGTVFWIIGWIIGYRRRRPALSRAVLILAVACVVAAAAIAQRYRIPHAYVLADDTPLRDAPYGPAPSRGILEAADAVVVRRAERDWRLVTAGATQGWLHSSEVLEP